MWTRPSLPGRMRQTGRGNRLEDWGRKLYLFQTWLIELRDWLKILKTPKEQEVGKATSEVARETQVDQAFGRPSIYIYGPEDLTLIVEPYGNTYVWTLRNDSLTSLPEVRLELLSACSLNRRKRAFRSAMGLRFKWLSIPELAAGEFTGTSTLLWFEGDCLCFGSKVAPHRLSWPNGDPCDVQRWRFEMNVIGAQSACDSSYGSSGFQAPTCSSWLIALVLTN